MASPRLATALTLAVALLPSAVPAPAAAQGTHPTVSNVVPETASETIYAKIQAIQPETWAVTLAAANGLTTTVIAAQQAALDKLKVGDRVKVHYYRSVAFMISKSMQVPKGHGAHSSRRSRRNSWSGRRRPRCRAA